MEVEANRSISNQPSSHVRPGGKRSLLHLSGLLAVMGFCWLAAASPAGAQQTCAHDLCEVGDGLSSMCDPCVADICQFDSYCCQSEWDDFCVEKVLTTCGDWTCAAECSHNLCETGEPLESTCSSCAAFVCFQDPTCCTDDWSTSCVQLVQNTCGYQCEAGADTCADAEPIYSGRTFGTLTGSTNDGCETGQDSCSSGDVWYTYTQAVEQDFVISTCATERSFGIDSVLSIHTGCPGRKNNEILANDDFRLGFVPNECDTVPSPHFLDSALPIAGGFALDVGETVVIRVAHHTDSVRGNFELKILPEPNAWLALVAGAGTLGVLYRRRARG
jgi:hypothetical protein